VKQDPLALALFGAALALLAGLLAYVFFFLKAPEPAPPSRAFDFLREKFRDNPAPAPAPRAAPPVAKVPPVATVPRSGAPVGHTWRYAVVVEPPAWRDITLTYRTQQEAGGLAVLTDFVYAGGKTNFHLGIYAPGHPSHANTRFPGFFMYPSYFPLPLEPGQRLAWGWPWQPQREGRMKRYDAKVLRWEDVTVPAGTFKAAVIEADLFYIEDGQVRGQAKETLWYAPQVAQLVKVVRVGRTPDEGLDRIVAELAEYR
jgi:hypothetical protein